MAESRRWWNVSVLAVSALVALGGARTVRGADDVCSGAGSVQAAAAAPKGPLPDAAGSRAVAGGARQSLRSASAAVRLLARAHGRLPFGRQDYAVGLVNADHDDSYVYRLPYADAASYAVLQSYGSPFSHRGTEFFTVDFAMPEGTLVYAARGGVVMLADDSQDRACFSDGCGRFANYVVILHADGTTGEYFHLAQHSVLVRVGEPVVRGQVLARSGNTGYTTTPHLHFGVYRAQSDGSSQSIAVRFATRRGIVNRPRPGARYLNPTCR